MPIAARVFSVCVRFAQGRNKRLVLGVKERDEPAVCLGIVTMKKVFRVAVFILVYALAVIGFEYFSYRYYLDLYLSSSTEFLIVVAVNLVFLVVFLLYRYKTREKRLAEAADRFLVRRARERATPIAASTRSIRRWLLWVPCLLVFIESMFVPETIGIASHIFSNRTVQLDKYRVKTPITWIVRHNHGTYLWALPAPGWGRIGLRRYWRHEVPASEISFYPVSHPEDQLTKNVPLNDATILAKRSFELGGEALTCWDLIHHNRFVDPLPVDSSIADVGCSSDSEDFYAHFGGWRGDLPGFYKTLQNIESME